MIGQNIMTALICILGALIAIWIAIFSIWRELHSIWRDGVRETKELQIDEDMVHKIVNMVMAEVDNKYNWSRDLMDKLESNWDDLDDETRKEMVLRVKELIK